jgi:hypothetical protein
LINKTWEDIWCIFSKINKEISKKNKQSVSHFLILQLGEYLIMNNLIFNPYEMRFTKDDRQGQLNIIINELQNKIENDECIKQYKDYLITERKYTMYTGKQLGKSKNAHYVVNFKDSNTIGISLTLFKIKLDEKIKFLINKYVKNKINDANISNKKEPSIEQVKLQNYKLSIQNYRDIKKEQTNPSINTLLFSVNLFEIGLNVKEKENKFKGLIDTMFFDIYNSFIGNGWVKQIELQYEIKIYDFNSNKHYKEFDIRKINHNLINYKKGLIKEMVTFIKDTMPLAVSCGLMNLEKK